MSDVLTGSGLFQFYQAIFTQVSDVDQLHG